MVVVRTTIGAAVVGTAVIDWNGGGWNGGGLRSLRRRLAVVGVEQHRHCSPRYSGTDLQHGHGEVGTSSARQRHGLGAAAAV